MHFFIDQKDVNLPGFHSPSPSLSSIHRSSAGSQWEIMSGLETGIPGFGNEKAQ
jgi:hypothetical protein